MDSKDIQSIDSMLSNNEWALEETEEESEPSSSLVDPQRSAKNRMITSVFVLALLVMGAVTTFYLSRRSIDIRQRASGKVCTIETEGSVCTATERCFVSNAEVGIGTCISRETTGERMISPSDTSNPLPTTPSVMETEFPSASSDTPLVSSCKLTVDGVVVNENSPIRIKKGTVVRIVADSPEGTPGLALSPADLQQWTRPDIATMNTTLSWNWTAENLSGGTTNKLYIVCNNTNMNQRCTGNPWCENGACLPILDCGTSDKATVELY